MNAAKHVKSKDNDVQTMIFLIFLIFLIWKQMERVKERDGTFRKQLVSRSLAKHLGALFWFCAPKFIKVVQCAVYTVDTRILRFLIILDDFDDS